MKFQFVFILVVYFLHTSTVSNRSLERSSHEGNNSSQKFKVDQNSSSSKYHSTQKPLEYLMFLYEVFEVFSSNGNENELKDDMNGCLFVKSEEDVYSYKSSGSNDICGLYVIAQVIEFQFLDFDVSCHNGGLVSVIDGWELNGQFFPSEKDHSLSREKRYTEYCGDKVPYARFVTQQNVGLIEFRIPNRNEGFKVKVIFHTNPTPCNALIEIGDGTYTISNFGNRVNCTISVLFPTSFDVLSLEIGDNNETGNSNKNCTELANGDFLEIRGSNGLDYQSTAAMVNFCGHSNKRSVAVTCSVASITMVSSGNYNNTASIGMDFIFDPDPADCPIHK